MTAKTLELAIDRVAELPEAAQEEIGRELLEHIEKRRLLLADLEEGTRSLAAGKGRPLDMEAVIRQAHAGA